MRDSCVRLRNDQARSTLLCALAQFHRCVQSCLFTCTPYDAESLYTNDMVLMI